MAREAAAWIRKQRQPWLAWVSVLNPHHIYSIPDSLQYITPRKGVTAPVERSAQPGRQTRRTASLRRSGPGQADARFTPDDWLRYRTYYLQLLEKADANLGTVLDAVPDLDSTVAVYTADHGDALGEHGLPYKGPFMYEEEIRIPLMVRAPGLMPAAIARIWSRRRTSLLR